MKFRVRHNELTGKPLYWIDVSNGDKTLMIYKSKDHLTLVYSFDGYDIRAHTHDDAFVQHFGKGNVSLAVKEFFKQERV